MGYFNYLHAGKTIFLLQTESALRTTRGTNRDIAERQTGVEDLVRYSRLEARLTTDARRGPEGEEGGETRYGEGNS